ncbi:hypothetical protein LZ318_05180 [Saccharopolyspora indica]|uniref:hypothetical protein n=1 Tax=Saccharopolyspora indica TaxID=1229659 RepID=UPI0022EB1DE1|nr:hypothetical protein [Saccharopolyspora indica]MDA3648445.1 hypothetical protein [Saccharopolyspora indica]
MLNKIAVGSRRLGVISRWKTVAVSRKKCSPASGPASGPASPRFSVVVAFGVVLAFCGFLWLVCITVP